jgi:hypothetical protein
MPVCESALCMMSSATEGWHVLAFESDLFMYDKYLYASL